jgi:hypothetical protein
MYRDSAACAEAVKQFAPTYDHAAMMKKYEDEKAKFDTELVAWKEASAKRKRKASQLRAGHAHRRFPANRGKQTAARSASF